MPGSASRATFKAESFPTVRAIVYPRPTHNQSADSAGRYRICKDEIPLFYLGLLGVRRRYGMLRDAYVAERVGFEPTIRKAGFWPLQRLFAQK
jgi:hypothetical protein